MSSVNVPDQLSPTHADTVMFQSARCGAFRSCNKLLKLHPVTLLNFFIHPDHPSHHPQSILASAKTFPILSRDIDASIKRDDA
jgi:hypothetical protein